MAKGKENANTRSGGESDFEVETIIGRLDKMHYVFLKDVDEIKHSVISIMAKQRTEFELKMQRKDEQLIRAEKEIDDLNKENEHLKRTQLHLEKCFRRCSVELKRIPLSEIQQEINCVETVNRPLQEKEMVNTYKTGQQNDLEASHRDINVQDPANDFNPVIGLIDHHESPSHFPLECQLRSADDGDSEPVKESDPIISSETILPESTAYLPVYKFEDQVFDNNETCSVKSSRLQVSLPLPSGPKFLSTAIQELTSSGNEICVVESNRLQLGVPLPSGPEFPSATSQQLTSSDGDCELPVKASNCVIPSGDIVPEFIDYLSVYKTEDQVFQADVSARLELAGPSTDRLRCSDGLPEQECTEDLPGQEIKEEQFDDTEVFQPANTEVTQFRPECMLNEEDVQMGLIPIESQVELSDVMSIYQCDICEARFGCWNLLQGHRKCHGDRTGLKRHKCELCVYSTDKSHDLKKHMRSHTKEKPYMCQVCHKAFAKSSSRNRHMTTHTKEKRYQCHMCHKAFYQKYDLHDHMRTHTKEKPYVCHLCHQAFNHRNHVKYHIKVHH